MEIYFEKTDKIEKFKLNSKMLIKDVLDKFDIITESVILVKNGVVCLENVEINDKDELKILSVVSGG